MECVNYNPRYIDLVLIPREIFLHTCVVRDKTLLFIWTFMRIVFLSIITYMLYDSHSTIRTITCSLLIIYILINIILLLLIIFKDKDLDFNIC